MFQAFQTAIPRLRWPVLDAVGPCMDLENVHVPNSYIKVGFQLTSNLKINKAFDFPWIRILFMYNVYILKSRLISMDGA